MLWEVTNKLRFVQAMLVKKTYQVQVDPNILIYITYMKINE